MCIRDSTRDGHPLVGSLKISVLTIMKIIKINATNNINIPTTEAIASGAVEKATTDVYKRQT